MRAAAAMGEGASSGTSVTTRRRPRSDDGKPARISRVELSAATNTSAGLFGLSQASCASGGRSPVHLKADERPQLLIDDLRQLELAGAHRCDQVRALLVGDVEPRPRCDRANVRAG